MKKSLFYLWICLYLFSACGPSGTNGKTNSGDEEPDTVKTVWNLPADFELEELFVPSKHDLGTWVALAEGPNKTIYASDQHGSIYHFQIPDVGDTLEVTDVDSINLDIKKAHGLMWAFNSLYVAVNTEWTDSTEVGSGIYRLYDRDNDGDLDDYEMLMKLEGHGEHGPHSFILGPAGKDIYFIAGNHTLVPEELAANSRIPNRWGEDNLLPPYLDARGHANEIKAPGGWIMRMDPEMNEMELISVGFRNAFDFGFNAEGELFAFDADMEWDFGMPWYRPIRICHVTSGSEFGWRTGSGKWPTYYPDALPSVVDLGQGSPTAVLMGRELNFPNHYKTGLFAADWSFGTLYYVDLKESGSTYTGTKEEFLSGVPLPLTDVIAGSDGHMYFAVGGRRLKSYFYRLRYTGDEETKTANQSQATNPLRGLRHDLESLHSGPVSGGVEKAWKNLDHRDQFVRYAARIGLEHQALDGWVDRALDERNPGKKITALIALARMGSEEHKSRLIRALTSISWNQLTRQNKLDLLRCYELTLCRMGIVGAAESIQLIRHIRQIFPSSDNEINREAAEILIYLRDEKTTEDAVDLMLRHTKENTMADVAMLEDDVSSRHEDYGKVVKEVVANRPPAEAIFYAVLLSRAETGWTKDLREKYFNWFFDVLSAKGGMSFKAFMENIRLGAMSNVHPDDQEFYQEISGVYSPTAELANLPKPEGPGNIYNMHAIGRILRQRVNNNNYEGSYEDGKRVFEAALCSSCHRMNGEGGSSGPDLTQINTRFEKRDILEAIFSPNDAISDQYAFTLFTLKDGQKKAGRIFSENDEKVVIMPNPYTSTIKEEIYQAEISESGLSPISPMPPGLLNPLNEQEIADLFVYLYAGGDKEYFYYGGEKGLEEEAD